jgi:hypothetical protein
MKIKLYLLSILLCVLFVTFFLAITSDVSYAIDIDLSNAEITENSKTIIKIDKIFTKDQICWANFEWNSTKNSLVPIDYDCYSIVLFDSFDGIAINDSIWEVFGVPEKGEVWQDDRLYIQKEAGDDIKGVGVCSTFGLEGDFDIRVEWNIEEMESTGWDVEMRLVANFDGGDWAITMRDARFGYSFCWKGECVRVGSTSDMEGTLRLTRTGDTVRSFFGPVGAFFHEEFTEIGNGHVLNPPGIALNLKLDVFAYGENDSFYGSYDNFMIRKGTPM